MRRSKLERSLAARHLLYAIAGAHELTEAGNLKTAKALGLDVPQTLLAGADELIE